MDQDALRGLNPLSDPHLQTRALQYFEHLKNIPDGWKICAETFTNGSCNGDDHVRFFCLQVVEHFFKTRYKNCSVDEQQNVRRFIGTCLQIQGGNTCQEKSFLKNKLTQITALAFVVDYPERWPSFFTDLLQSLSPNPNAVDIYLRVMLAIDSEVADREINNSDEVLRRNTLIKDAMREQCINQLTDSWYQILTTYETTDPEITCMCLDVIGKFISWIDISLIANDKFVPVLLKFMSNVLVRESACDCIHDIINKGMDPVAKTKLIESFTEVLENAGVLNPNEDEEGDFLAKLSKLVNGFGTNLILNWQKLVKLSDKENTAAVLQAIENKIPLMFRYLGDEDDDVSGAITPFAQDYIAVLKQIKPLSQKQLENIKGLVYTVVKKMKYDESYNFDHEGEEEAMFQEYRKQLRTIFNNLAALDVELIIMTVHTIVTQTLPQWETHDVADIEMAINLLYTLGEALPSTQGQHFTGDPTKASALQEMMRLLVTSRVSCHGHMIVMLQFFETVVRYDKFFNCEPQHIPDVLMAFTDERGFRHQSPQVRSRTSYLFSRFVKGLRLHMNAYLEDILKRIQDLLVLNTPDNGYQRYLSNEDQLFVYETAGSLIVSSNLSVEKKQMLMKELLSPIASKFESLLNKLAVETDEGKQTAYAQTINTATALASRVSKGFSNQHTMKMCGCVEIFTDLLQIFLKAVNVPIHRQLIQTGVRQYLHRMVVCIEKEILPFIPLVFENLMKQPDAKELSDFIPLMNQIIMKFKSAISPFLQEMFMPLVRTIFSVLSSPVDDGDQVTATEKKMLQRSYYLFISTIVTNDGLDVLKNQAELVSIFNVLEWNNDVERPSQDTVSYQSGHGLERLRKTKYSTLRKPHPLARRLTNFELLTIEMEDLKKSEMQNLHQVLITIVQGAADIPDPQSQKMCFNILKRLIDSWGGKDGIAGFIDFMYESIVPACFLAPLKPTFDFNDGQTALALNECAACLKAVLEKRGDEMLNYLQGKYLPTLNLPPDSIQEFCQALNSDTKLFRAYLKTFFMKAKS